jgi:hypothetical protein
MMQLLQIEIITHGCVGMTHKVLEVPRATTMRNLTRCAFFCSNVAGPKDTTTRSSTPHHCVFFIQVLEVPTAMTMSCTFLFQCCKS